MNKGPESKCLEPLIREHAKANGWAQQKCSISTSEKYKLKQGIVHTY